MAHGGGSARVNFLYVIEIEILFSINVETLCVPVLRSIPPTHPCPCHSGGLTSSSWVRTEEFLGPNREFGSFSRKFPRKECFQSLVATYANKTLSAPPSTEEVWGGHSGTLPIISHNSSVAARLAMIPTATPAVYQALTGRGHLTCITSFNCSTHLGLADMFLPTFYR